MGERLHVSSAFRPRRAPALLIPLVVAMLATVTVTGLGVAPAAAETKLEVDAGYADGNFIPGRIVPVRVVIQSDRLIRSTLQVRIHQPGNEMPPLSVPVEVSGGSNKTVVIGVPTPSGLDRATVVVKLAGESLAGEADIRFTGETELVGLLPGVVSRDPEPLTLPGDLGTASFATLDKATMATPGALDPLGTIVAGPDGLTPLNAAVRRNVLSWLDQGGRLVVDAAPGDEVVGLPEAWQPGEASRLAAGRGEVVLADGAVAASRWGEIIVPTPMVTPSDLGGGMIIGSEDVATSVGRDGGLRVPSVSWLGMFLGGYVLLVGPLAFVVLRRLRRSNWTWAVVSVSAIGFAAGAFLIGNDLRSGSQASHGTIVETSPAGARALSYVGLVSRSGEDGRAVFPEGWTAASLDTALSGGWMDMGPRFPGGDDPFTIDPAQVSQSAGHTVGEVDLDPGGVGMVVGWGELDGVDGLEVTAVAHLDGSVTGTVRNTTDQTLRKVLVMVGFRSWDGGELAPGEEADWTLKPVDPDDEADIFFSGEIPEEPWDEAVNWDGPPAKDTPINYALWSEKISRQADPYPTGVVVAAGWSRTWTPPIEASGSIDKGRTVFTTSAPVLAEPGSAPRSAVLRELVRSGRVTPVDGDRFGKIDEEWGPLTAGVLRFTLPAGTDPAALPGLQARLPAYVLAAEAWDGEAWVPLTRTDERGRVVDDDSVLGDDFDPWEGGTTTADVEPTLVHDGSVLLRVQMVDVGGGVDLPSVGQVR